MISSIVVNELIEIGAGSVPRAPTNLRLPHRAWRQLMQGDEPWRVVAKSLSSPRLCDLIRGLVLFSQVGDWNSGSVSPIIPLYRESLTRDNIDEPALTSWIVENRRNDYEPFGTVVADSVRTQADLALHLRARAASLAARLARQAERQAAAAEVRAGVATGHLAAAVRRGDIAGVQGLLLQGAVWKDAFPSGESLVQLARANGRESLAVFLEQQEIT